MRCSCQAEPGGGAKGAPIPFIVAGYGLRRCMRCDGTDLGLGVLRPGAMRRREARDALGQDALRCVDAKGCRGNCPAVITQAVSLVFGQQRECRCKKKERKIKKKIKNKIKKKVPDHRTDHRPPAEAVHPRPSSALSMSVGVGGSGPECLTEWNPAHSATGTGRGSTAGDRYVVPPFNKHRGEGGAGDDSQEHGQAVDKPKLKIAE